MEGAAEEGWMTMEKEDKPRGILSDAEYAEWEADMLKLIEYSESRFRSAEEQSTRALEAMLPSNAPWPRARLDEQFRAERAEAYVEKLKIDVSGYKGTIGELIDRVHAEMARAEKAERALDDVDESRARAIRAVVAAQWGAAITALIAHDRAAGDTLKPGPGTYAAGVESGGWRLANALTSFP